MRPAQVPCMLARVTFFFQAASFFEMAMIQMAMMHSCDSIGGLCPVTWLLITTTTTTTPSVTRRGPAVNQVPTSSADPDSQRRPALMPHVMPHLKTQLPCRCNKPGGTSSTVE